MSVPGGPTAGHQRAGRPAGGEAGRPAGAVPKSTFRTHATASSLTVWQAAKEAAVPLLVYQACALFSYAAFSGAVVLADGMDPEGIIILAGLALATFGGVTFGQLLAFLRVRTWLVVSFGALCWFGSFAMMAAGTWGLGEIGAVLSLGLFVFPIALSGGLWSLETHRALWATWLPLLFSTAAVIIWTEERGTVANWFAGEKWAIWDVVSGGVLGVTILLILAFLVSRETHRLALWRRGPTAPLAPSLREKGAARPRVTLLGLLILGGLAVALTVMTALVAPYLWRTGDEGDRESSYGEPTEEPAEPPPDWGESELLKRIAEQLQKMAEQGGEAAKQAGGVLCSILTLLLLAILGWLLGYRPLKRLFLLRHLREPFWDVPPTTRIEQGWRLVEIALADAGVFPRPGEDAAGLARRAAPVLAKLSPVEVHGLEDAAEVADRVRFGLGVGPEDVEVMQRFSAWAIDTVWERLDDKEQIRCMYRDL